MAYTADYPMGQDAAFVGDKLELYRRMWVLRLLDMAFEELRIDGRLAAPGQPAFGQEAVAVGTAAALRPGDTLNTTIAHVQHAQQAGLSLPLAPAIAAMNDARGSRQISPGTDWKHGVSSVASPLEQATLFAVGDAHAQRLAGAGEVTLCVLTAGEANSAEATAAASIAMSWDLPMVFVVESVRYEHSARKPSHLQAFHGMPVVCVDGNDVAAVRDTVAEAVRRASAGEGPALVEAITHRTMDVAGVDSLVFARQRLVDAGVSAGHLYEVERRARHLVAEAESFGMAAVRSEAPAPIPQPEPWPAA
jgi:TPP-dependent pyruvate/acetoin dehydrogenase alpha subunit